jgi:hypothetical protein
MSKSPEPLPSCQNQTMKPQTAPIETMLKRIAFSGSSNERKTRASRRKVIAMITSAT